MQTMWQAEVKLGGLLNFWNKTKNTDSCGTWRQKRRQHWMKPKMLFSQFCCQLWSKQIRGSLVRECGKIASAPLPSHTGEKLKLGGSWFANLLICRFADLLMCWFSRLTLEKRQNWEGPDLAADTALLRRWQTSKQAAEVFVQQTPWKAAEGVCSANTFKIRKRKCGAAAPPEKIRSNQFSLLPNGGQSVAPSAINLTPGLSVENN